MKKDKKNEAQPNPTPQENANGTPAEGNATAPKEQPAMVALSFEEYEALQKEAQDNKAKAEEYFDGWQRERADFLNYKKRVDRDAVNMQTNTLSAVVKNFLVILDDLERALKNRPAAEAEGWVDGIQLISNKLKKLLENQGVEQLTTNIGDEFDPNFHEAISHEDHAELESGKIIEVLQAGYKIGERTIRPAMVRVAR